MKSALKGLLCLIVLLVLAVPVYAVDITVDGNLDDWGLSGLAGSSSDWSNVNNWVAKPGVAFVVEDNNNPNHLGLPGFYGPGVHIKGSNANHPFYDEPALILKSTGKPVASPYAGEKYDIEAMYVTYNKENIYVAAILSMPQEGYGVNGLGQPAYAHDETPGDLALNFAKVPGEVAGYEYGVKISPWKNVGNYNVGDIVHFPNWTMKGYTQNVAPDPTNLPDEMANSAKYPPLPSSEVVGKATIAYTNSWLQHNDHGAGNWVLEVAIPRSAVKYYDNVGLNNVLLTQNCQNEHIYVPEFPTIAVSLGAIIGLIFIIFSYRKE